MQILLQQICGNFHAPAKLTVLPSIDKFVIAQYLQKAAICFLVVAIYFLT
jgi:hypothetical protein